MNKPRKDSGHRRRQVFPPGLLKVTALAEHVGERRLTQ